MVGHRSTRPALAVLALLAGGVALSGAGCSSGGGSSDATGPTTTFLVETDEGTQAFGRDDEAGSFSFEGDDGRGTLTFDLDGDGVVAAGDDGVFELSPGAPTGWPGDFPLPLGAEIVGGNVVEAGPLRQLTTLYRVAAPGAEVVEFYEKELVDWLALVDIRDDTDEGFQASVSFEGDQVGFVSVSRVDGTTELAVQLVVED
jgi:hypothetical protein